MNTIYFIGGSPCSGKSTVAEWIAKEYELYYFKVDDFLDSYTEKGAFKQKKICLKQSQMTPEQTWMRNPVLQKDEELAWYHEVFEFIIEDLEKIDAPNGIITEGAAYLPELMRQRNIDKYHFVSITPTKEFQVNHYQERPWVPYVLEGCSDKKKAFENWMERDTLFAKEVRRQCIELGYASIVVSDESSAELSKSLVCKIFKLTNMKEYS